MPAAYFLFSLVQVVSRRRTSCRQGTIRRALPNRGQATLYRVRRVLCVEVKQRQILPEMPQAYYPATSRRAHEEKTRYCYAVGAKKALYHAAFRPRKSRGKEFIPFPLKMAFYAVTKSKSSTHTKAGAVAMIAWLPRPFFFCVILPAFCSLAPFRLTLHFQNAVYVLLDNTVLFDFLFQLAIVGV